MFTARVKKDRGMRPTTAHESVGPRVLIAEKEFFYTKPFTRIRAVLQSEPNEFRI